MSAHEARILFKATFRSARHPMIKTLIAFLSICTCSVHSTAVQNNNVSRARDDSTSTARTQQTLERSLMELSQQITGKIGADQKRTIAVLEFTDLKGNVQTSAVTCRRN
jgi:hypothetical protein